MQAMSEQALTVILAHEHTDFDALASLLAASLLFPEALPVLPGQLNRNVREFVALYRNQFPFLAARELPRQPVKRVILVDTNAANLPKGLQEDTDWLIIDHHVPRDPAQPSPHVADSQGEVQLWHEPLGANTTLILEKLIEQGVTLTTAQATLLALGIHEDTGSLTYGATSHRDAQCLAWLMEPARSVNLEIVHQFLRHPLTQAQRTLLETLIDQSEFQTVAGHTVLIAQAHAPKFEDELSTLAHRLRDIHDADAIFLIVGLDDLVQVVARSVTDDIDVGAVVRGLGGGGHPRAAAAPVRDTTVQAVRKQILASLANHTEPVMTVRQIMTSGRPQMLAPDLKIEEAHLLMRRYGHEGFPVVAKDEEQGERLLGVITRREADRALNHGLGEQPVRRFMQAGPGGRPVTVRPTDAIPTLRKAMIESGWGQIPVVDEAGTIIGIVTRTDLIKLWDENEPPERHAAEIDRRLRTALAPAQLQLLRRIGEEVDQMGYAVYIVGGFVRDLLLNQASRRLHSLDMDIVVEGDAIAFAGQLQALYGGRVVTHKRFGTAKWLLDDADQPVRWEALLADLQADADGVIATDVGALQAALPPHLDFVTARTEFYTAPTVLPTVELSNIKLDLHRRDFTINTLAFSLNPERWGELLDFYGGLPDLEQGMVRVLHSLSFVDDPTRILRAVRYEQRFDFTIEPRTLELLQDAIELIERVTPARIRHELERILQEEQPERVLKRLAELGILQAIQPELRVDEWLERQFARLRTMRQQSALDPRLAEEPIEWLYWGLLVLRLPASAHPALQERLGLRRELQQTMHGFQLLHEATERLRDPALRPSEIVALLEPVDDVAQALYLLAEVDPQISHALQRYRDEWHQVQPLLTGYDLQRMGIPPGPIYSTLLDGLRAARLDGEIQSREAEAAWVQQRLNEG
jgi:tRNA nucleotidyltransferase (CCA-adding enzyme)